MRYRRHLKAVFVPALWPPVWWKFVDLFGRPNTSRSQTQIYLHYGENHRLPTNRYATVFKKLT
ncbi:hypothetical protein GQ43DRAFT_438237 [Delitschia confertaspora ATCC 74209]|uniref:Secreted protein n=1 Tax=Delitschia confertaspora ATCC 74209 TaxID=1513339 RepID=A0A9P4JRZ1_9PLEO|nr:hypothetical protein GQ43DRAFT_438237 [Delitschia confertaspora ATCC 74209]